MRKAKARVILCILSFIFLITSSTIVNAADRTIRLEGNIDSLAKAILRYRTARRPPVILYTFKNENASEIIVAINLYHSDFSERVIYRDNCVASGWDKVIDCDLKLLDNLIDGFRLIEIFGRGNNEAERREYRHYLLMWVIAHELGHIAKGHPRSDFADPPSGMSVFDVAKQAKEIDADAYAVKLIGNLNTAEPKAYATIMDVTNSLIRKSVCPRTYPAVCPEMPSGVGLIFDYTKTAQPIVISLGGEHPDFVVRFLRILYVSGIGTSQNTLNNLARKAIDLLKLDVGGDPKSVATIKEKFQQ